MNTPYTPIKINENEISERINIIDQNTIEYIKSGHGKIKTSKSLNAVRLELALDESGLTQKELASLSKVKQPTISRIVEGKTKLSRHIPTIASALGVSSEWLAGLETGTQKINNNLLRISGENFILISMYCDDFDSQKNFNQDQDHKDKERDSYIMIPERLINSTIGYSNLAFITVKDNANFPDIMNGSAVTFDKSDKNIINGNFFVINYGVMKFVVRELYMEPNGDIRIKPKQKNFPEYIVSRDTDSFNILGRVITVTNIY